MQSSAEIQDEFPKFSFGIIQKLEVNFLHNLDYEEENKFLAAVLRSWQKINLVLSNELIKVELPPWKI